MAQTASVTQIPQHVSALLSHLTSRPGVQSTLILSRKDGSIIQCTGLLAASASPSSNNTPTPAVSAPSAIDNSVPSPTTAEEAVQTIANEAVDSPVSPTGSAPAAPAPATKTPYRPSQAEALAAHIHAYVAAASNLGSALTNPGAAGNGDSGYLSRPSSVVANGMGKLEEGEGEGMEGEEDDEVKLLRLRTKKHEVVVVPDRKFLLCVVHGVTGAATSGGTAGGGR